MPREFNLKDFFFYSINRWVYVLLAVALAVLCAVAAYGYDTMQKRDTVAVEASVVLCEIETYAAAFEANGQGSDSTTLTQGYFDNSKRAIDAMMAQSNATGFVQSAENRAVLYALDAQLNGLSATTLASFVQERIVLTAHSYWVHLQMSYLSRESGYREVQVKAFLDAYAAFLRTRALESVDSFGDMEQMFLEGTLARPPMRLVAASTLEANVVVNSVLKPIGMGVLVGMGVALLALMLVFMLDPKMKSGDELREAGFPILVEIESGEFCEDKLAMAVASLDKAQCICVVQTGADGGVSFGNALAQYLGRAGNQVLLIDGTKKNGRFRDYIAGDDTALTRCKDADVAEFFASDDFVYLLAKRERFQDLQQSYNKILICCDIHVAGAVAACSSFTAAAVCVSDRTTKTKDIFAVAQELSDTIEIKHGIVYARKTHN